MKQFILLVMLLTTISLIACSISPATPTQTTAHDTATVSPVAPTIPTTTLTQTTASNAAEEAEIRNLVENFGKRLADVGLLAPDAAQQMQKQYSEFVSPALLEMWMNDVLKAPDTKAPGRMVSSPWPDRIEITTLSKEGPDRYEITGFVVEITSTEIFNGGAAAKIPVRIVVQKSQGRWLITGYAEEIQTSTPSASPVPTIDVSGSVQLLEGPNFKYTGILFTLDPTIGSHLYVFDETVSIDGKIAHYTRFSLFSEEYCQTWCLNVYPIAEFEQAFGSFVFPPAGYRGGAAVIFKAQEMALSFQNGSGDRELETHGQNHYGVSNESLKYVFRGYTVNKRYAVYVEAPIHAATLPDIAPTMTTDASNICEHNRKYADVVNALTSADFSPRLDLLDALVLSIHVNTP